MNIIERINAKVYALIFWQTGLGEIANKIYDLNIFYSNYFTESKIKNRANFEAYLTKQYHIVEKGLALPESRKGFGKRKINLLLSKTKEYIILYGEDRITANIKETLKQYLDRNEELMGLDLPFHTFISDFVIKERMHNTGGVKKINLNEIQNAVSIDFEKFVKTRNSVRNYSSVNVSEDSVFKAVEIARYTPSVCNRQSWRVHYFKDKVLKNQLLKLQGGNGGFTDSINQLLIVTSDVSRFTKLESNQVFTDGGLFSMNLLLALHSQKIGSCCLNVCVPYLVEEEIKKIGNIPHHERLIMMIGIGMLKDSYEVAISDRIPTNQILNIK
jgi:nitroreductase